MATLRVTVQGRLGEMSALTVAAVLQRSIRVLQNLDRRISGRSGGTAEWVIAGLSEGSASFLLASRPRPKVIEDVGSLAVYRFTGGITQIENTGGIPAYFSPDDVSSVRAIVREFGRDGVSGVLYGVDDGEPVQLTPTSKPELDRLIGKSYHAFGSIEGRIELVSIQNRGRRFNITQDRTFRAVKCTLPEDVQSTVIHAMDDRRRVVATGLITYNSRDEAIALRLTEPLRFLGTAAELPTSQDLGGSDPSITGELSTEDYVRSLRDD